MKGGMEMSEVASAIIYLDDDMPEYMLGLIRVGSVELFDTAGQQINDSDLLNKLVDNTEYQESEHEKLVADIAKALGIDKDNVTIE